MRYRARNIRTNATVLHGEDFIAENSDPEWVLEFELDTDEWQVSGFHIKDITGVKDPRPFEQIKAELEEPE